MSTSTLQLKRTPSNTRRRRPITLKPPQVYPSNLLESTFQSSNPFEHSDFLLPLVACKVFVSYSYSPITFTTTLSTRLIDNEHISVNLIVDEINKQIPLNSFQIAYREEEENEFLYCGIYPLKTEVKCKFSKEGVTNLYLRLRQIFKRDNMLRMEFAEEENENGEEPAPQREMNDNGVMKNKRSKERKIGYIIKKVYMWRKMYCGFVDEKGRHVKLNLEEAAEKIGISKKSLDDYLIQLRMGQKLGFNFNEHKNDKVGVLRTFIKKNKNAGKKGKSKNENN